MRSKGYKGKMNRKLRRIERTIVKYRISGEKLVDERGIDYISFKKLSGIITPGTDDQLLNGDYIFMRLFSVLIILLIGFNWSSSKKIIVRNEILAGTWHLVEVNSQYLQLRFREGSILSLGTSKDTGITTHLRGRKNF